jgi:hypothetical protein
VPHTVPILGVQPTEIYWIQLLIRLLRDPDPVTAELARQALTYVAGTAKPVGNLDRSA